MLDALKLWWRQTIREGISLSQEEQDARDREEGDGSPQQFVVKQIEELFLTVAGRRTCTSSADLSW